MKRLALGLLLLCAMPLQASQLTRDYQFQPLRGQEQQTLAHLEGQSAVLMFFEPECPWCVKQAAVLKKLHQLCPGHLQPVALGVNGNQLALKRALFRLNFPFEPIERHWSWSETWAAFRQHLSCYCWTVRAG